MLSAAQARSIEASQSHAGHGEGAYFAPHRAATKNQRYFRYIPGDRRLPDQWLLAIALRVGYRNIRTERHD